MLTIEQQKRLTEFLGECWHKKADHAFYHYCAICNVHLPRGVERLDFSDWRVVGRLIEKFGFNSLMVCFADNVVLQEMAVTEPQLAICLAIDAYLVAKGEGK